jgi:peptidoglycan hydrolase-like protein with peptidoglycan-binding domain
MPLVTVDIRTLDLQNAATSPVTGRQVRTLQGLLNAWLRSADTPPHVEPDPLLDLDGVAGRATRSIALRFQEARRLHADAVIGPKTWAALVERVD